MIKIHTVKYFFLALFLLSYIVGFFFRENIAGGAEADFLNFTWSLISAFKNDFFHTIKNYGSFGEGNLPLFHILNAYLNPLTFNEFYFQGSITIISVINVIIFAQIIEKKSNIIGDFDFFLKLSLKEKFYCINTPLVFYRTHDGNLSKKTELYLKEMDHWFNENTSRFKKLRYSLRRLKFMYFKLKLKNIIKKALPFKYVF